VASRSSTGKRPLPRLDGGHDKRRRSEIGFREAVREPDVFDESDLVVSESIRHGDPLCISEYIEPKNVGADEN
jgi:hypothetical protein